MFPQEPLGKSGVPNIDWLIKPNCLASPGSPQYNQFKWLQQRSGWLPSLVCPTPASPCSSQVAGSVTNGAAVAHITGTCKGRVSEVAPRGTWRNPRNLRHLGCNSQRWNQLVWGNGTFLPFQGRYSLPKQWRFCLFRKTDLGNHIAWHCLTHIQNNYTQYPHGLASFMYYGSSLPHFGIITEWYFL